jgi:Protein of unknown function (DUF1778)
LRIAGAAQGKSRTEFILDAAYGEATSFLLDRKFFLVDDATSDKAFCKPCLVMPTCSAISLANYNWHQSQSQSLFPFTLMLLRVVTQVKASVYARAKCIIYPQ